MIRFVWQKLIHKKWLNMCTFLGIVLLVSVAAGNVLYQGAACSKLLQNKFDTYIGEHNAYPALVEAAYPFVYADREEEAVAQAKKVCETVSAAIENKLPVKENERVMLFTSDSLLGIPSYQSNDSKQDYFFIPSYMENMEEHTEILRGELFAEAADDEGIYECIVNENMVFSDNLSVGEVITFPKTQMKDGKELKIRIAGIFKENDNHDSYWVRFPNSYENNLFLSQAALDEIMSGREAAAINMSLTYDVFLDYESMSFKQANKTIAGLADIAAKPPAVKMTVKSELGGLLSSYVDAQNQVKATMRTLQIPLLVLLMVFLYMVSSHVFEMEQNEIAMLKSRGVGNGQILGVYFTQSFLLAIAGAVFGILLGWGFASLLGSANAFMEFVGGRRLRIVPDMGLPVSVLAAILAAILFMTLPVLRYTALSVVEIKHKKNATEKSLWERYYLDVALLALSLYIRYSLLKQQESLAQQIIRGESMDPVLFLSSGIFMLGCGMVFLRLLKLVVKAVYHIGRSRWKPAVYVSFLQIIRTGKKQNFISVFLILTIAMGIFYANTARTMNTSIEERIRYDTGADIVSSEQWKNNLPFAKKNKKLVTYEEPNFLRYEELSGQVQEMTKVIRDTDVRMYYGDKVFEKNMLMAIHTKEFGETAWMKENALDKHWYYYLNDISQAADGVLVSSNFRDKMGAQIGDSIKYTLFDELGNARALGTATIYGFVDIWPGYSPYREERTADGSISYTDNYLIVANYSQVVSIFGATPYEMWVKTDKGTELIKTFAEDKGIVLTNVVGVKDELIRSKNDASVQVTNGLLTISFLIILILCTVGFLIHWILVIKKRELMFGIYRAMGLSMGEVKYMLVHEQIFSSLTAIAAGAFVGFFASYLYIPLLMIAYLPKKHALAFEVVSAPLDMIRIGGVLSVMLTICFLILAKVVAGMKVAQALKLGED
ncbi:putative ABC transport system permease protein [Kineothrix alysoides]|uniref:Putative ABC transport system permease protein n=1 Tax=Kineothrix alysoides TaxID=1469948 RepID=A0A4R1R4X1_9FIRM|nr:ABC transporter permease [Kineothrix alysoides]TCL60488.1 putative ABC transport system permease protein [Kineothrix alysoides]